MSNLLEKNFAFLNQDNEVVNIAAFLNNTNQEIVNSVCIDNGGVSSIDCSIFGQPGVGWKFLENKWQDENNNLWEFDGNTLKQII